MPIEKCPRCTGNLAGGVHLNPCDPTKLVRDLEARVTELETLLVTANACMGERAAYREALERMAKDGCGCIDRDGYRCQDRSQDQETWCWSCIADHTLNP